MRYVTGILVIALAIGMVFPSEIEAKGKRQSVVIKTSDEGTVRLWKGTVLKVDNCSLSPPWSYVEVVNPDPIRNTCEEEKTFYEFEDRCDIQNGRKAKIMGFSGKGENTRILFKVVSRREDSSDCDECQKGVLFFMDTDDVADFFYDAIYEMAIKKKKRKIRRILQQ